MCFGLVFFMPTLHDINYCTCIILSEVCCTVNLGLLLSILSARLQKKMMMDYYSSSRYNIDSCIPLHSDSKTNAL